MRSTAEDLTKLWRKFSLLEDESVTVEVQNETLTEIVSKGKSCLVEKLIVDRAIGKDIIKSTLIRVWKSTGSLSFLNIQWSSANIRLELRS